MFFVNGLGFEGWIERLEKSAGFKGEVVVASKGVKPLTMIEEEGGAPETITDPHAWQDLANGKIYVANIRDGLIAADPDGQVRLRGERGQISRRHRRGGECGEGGARRSARGAPQDHHLA